METIGTFAAKTHLTRLLQRVADGEEFTITRHGLPVARLVPVKRAGLQQLRETIAKLKEFNKGQTLGGLKVKDLIDEGRR
jgi:prevent-host-death family protein